MTDDKARNCHCLKVAFFAVLLFATLGEGAEEGEGELEDVLSRLIRSPINPPMVNARQSPPKGKPRIATVSPKIPQNHKHVEDSLPPMAGARTPVNEFKPPPRNPNVNYEYPPKQMQVVAAADPQTPMVVLQGKREPEFVVKKSRKRERSPSAKIQASSRPQKDAPLRNAALSASPSASASFLSSFLASSSSPTTGEEMKEIKTERKQTKETINKRQSQTDSRDRRHNSKQMKATEKNQSKVISVSGDDIEILYGLPEVLKALNQTKEELHTWLQSRKVAFHYFLKYINSGVTQRQIEGLLKLPPKVSFSESLKKKDEKLSNKKRKKKLRRKHGKNSGSKDVEKFTFTEFVHDLDVNRVDELAVGFQPDVKLDYEVNDNVITSHTDLIEAEMDHESTKMAEYARQRYHPVASTIDEQEDPKRAEIASFSVEKQESNEFVSVTVGSQKPLDLVQDSAQILIIDDSKKLHKKNDSEKEFIQQANVKLFLPMKGILIFCGILGALVFVTTLIFIAYAAIKCKKPQQRNKSKAREQMS